MWTSTIYYTIREQKSITSHSRLLSDYINVERWSIKLAWKKNAIRKQLWKQVRKWKIKNEKQNQLIDSISLRLKENTEK